MAEEIVERKGIKARHVLAVAAVMGLLLFVVPMIFAPKPREFTIRFPSAEGVSKGTDVLVAGVVVGEVRAVEVSGDGKGADALVRLARSHEKSVFSPPGTTAFVKKKGLVFPATRIEIRNGGGIPIEQGALIKGSNDSISAQVFAASMAAEKAARLAKVELNRLSNSAAMDPKEWKEAAGKAREAARVALNEADKLRESTAGHFREFSESPEGKRYRDLVSELVSSIDTETSAAMRDTSGTLKRLGKGIEGFAGDVGDLDRRKVAGHVDEILGELQGAHEILHRLGRHVVVDAVRGPEDTTETLEIEMEETSDTLAESERP